MSEDIRDFVICCDVGFKFYRLKKKNCKCIPKLHVSTCNSFCTYLVCLFSIWNTYDCYEVKHKAFVFMPIVINLNSLN